MATVMESVEKSFRSISLSEPGKKAVHKEKFTALAGDKAEHIVKLAETALESKGKVYTSNENGQAVCWAIINFVEDSREGKKVKGHYDTVFLEAAQGYEDRMEEFKTSIKKILADSMAMSSKVTECRMDGETVYPSTVFGMKGLDEIGKKKINTPQFTALAGDRAETLKKLAEHALETKGKVYVLRGEDKNCVCWCIIDLVDDGMEGKKHKYHYEATAVESVEGYEKKMDQFLANVKGMINERMYLYGQASEFHIGDEIITPYKTDENPNLALAVAMGLLFGILFKSYLMGLCFFCLYLSIDTSYRVVTKKKKKDALEEADINIDNDDNI